MKEQVTFYEWGFKVYAFKEDKIFKLTTTTMKYSELTNDLETTSVKLYGTKYNSTHKAYNLLINSFYDSHIKS